MPHLSTLRRAGLLLCLALSFGAQAQVPNFTWTSGATAPLGRYEGLSTAVDGRLYVFGGFYTTGSIDATDRCDAYDPATNSWMRLASLPEPITHTALAYDGRGYLYLAGGFVGTHPGPITDHVWRYHIASNTWSAGPALPSPRGAGMLVCRGRTLHFFGGAARITGTTVQDFAEHLTLDLDAPAPAWVQRAPLPNPRNHLGGAVLNGKVYAIGGQLLDNEATGNQADVHEYDPATDTWTTKASMPRPLSHISATVLPLNNRLIVVSGVTNATGAVANIVEFDPVANVWREITPLPAPRHSPMAGLAGGRLVVSGGTYTQLHTDTWVSDRVLSTAPPAPGAASLYPNPVLVGETARYTWPTGSAAPVQAEIVDALGRVHRRTVLAGLAGMLPTAGLAAGLYLVRLQQGGQRAAGRLVVR
jgi:N-acetylneuraminic acid mutarotase